MVLAGAIDAAGKTLDAAAVRQAYASANVDVQPKAAWDAAAFRRVIA